ncbi:diguanylate cyclase [Alteromonas sp.]|nr:diguanylate cyclase [Alteromonas sp.]
MLVLRVIFIITLLLFGVLQVNASEIEEIEQLREKGEIVVAQRRALQLLERAKLTGDTQLKADTLFQLARNVMEQNNYPDAQQWLNQAIVIYQDLDNPLSIAKTYRQIGLTYRYQSNYSVSLEYLYMALAIFQSHGSQRDIASINNSLGLVLEKMGQFNEAVTHHQKALEANYALSNQQGIASALYNLADVRRVMGDYELALDYFNQALTIDEANGNKKDIAYSSYKIGYVNMQVGNYDVAAQYMHRAHSLFVDIGAKRDIDWALSGLSDLAYKEGKLIESESMVKGIITRAKEGQYRSLLLDAYQTLIEIYRSQERYGDAIPLIEEAISLAEEMGELHQVSQLLALKVDIQETVGEISEAYKALKLQKQLDEKLFNQNRLDSLASVQAQTEFIRQAHEIELLKQQQAVQEVELNSERENRRYLFLVFAALSVIAFLFYSRRAQLNYTKQLKQEVSERTVALEKANNELEAMSLTDNLTGLHNRRFLEAEIEADITRVLNTHQQAKSSLIAPTDLCFFVIDLDNFKQINDTYGHSVGDSVLKQTAQRLSDIFGESDYLIRWGGEEFVGVARSVDREEAASLARRIVCDMQNTPFSLNGGLEKAITCSVGFACFPFTSEMDTKHSLVSPLDTIFNAADQCLYAAKASGRATWVGVADIVEHTALSLPASIEALKALEVKGMIKLSLDTKP